VRSWQHQYRWPGTDSFLPTGIPDRVPEFRARVSPKTGPRHPVCAVTERSEGIMGTVPHADELGMKNSPYTPDGSVESASRFGRPGGGPRRRRNLRSFGLLLVGGAPIALLLLAVVVALLTD
jgi:hypothetical protein